MNTAPTLYARLVDHAYPRKKSFICRGSEGLLHNLGQSIQKRVTGALTGPYADRYPAISSNPSYVYREYTNGPGLITRKGAIALNGTVRDSGASNVPGDGQFIRDLAGNNLLVETGTFNDFFLFDQMHKMDFAMRCVDPRFTGNEIDLLAESFADIRHRPRDMAEIIAMSRQFVDLDKLHGVIVENEDQALSLLSRFENTWFGSLLKLAYPREDRLDFSGLAITRAFMRSASDEILKKCDISPEYLAFMAAVFGAGDIFSQPIGTTNKFEPRPKPSNSRLSDEYWREIARMMPALLSERDYIERNRLCFLSELRNWLGFGGDEFKKILAEYFDWGNKEVARVPRQGSVVVQRRRESRKPASVHGHKQPLPADSLPQDPRPVPPRSQEIRGVIARHGARFEGSVERVLSDSIVVSLSHGLGSGQLSIKNHGLKPGDRVRVRIVRIDRGGNIILHLCPPENKGLKQL